jgi:hypothetical protein
VKVRIKKTVYMPDLPSEVETEQGTTLRNVLKRIFTGTQFDKHVINPATGDIEIHGMLDVRVNDVPFYGLPRDLDTELHDDDTLTLSLVLLGGG